MRLSVSRWNADLVSKKRVPVEEYLDSCGLENVMVLDLSFENADLQVEVL